MSLPKFVVINGQRIAWREILKLRREQRQERPQQPTLFPLRQDARPETQRTAAGRFENPTLFKVD
jgi:hypothetical protein